MCKHSFCEICIREYALASQDSKLGCPVPICDKPLFLVDLEALLSQDELKELFLRQKYSFLEANTHKFKECPTPDCENILCSPDSEDALESQMSLSTKSLVFCDNCGNDYCFVCLKSHYDSDCKENKIKEVVYI